MICFPSVLLEKCCISRQSVLQYTGRVIISADELDLSTELSIFNSHSTYVFVERAPPLVSALQSHYHHNMRLPVTHVPWAFVTGKIPHDGHAQFIPVLVQHDNLVERTTMKICCMRARKTSGPPRKIREDFMHWSVRGETNVIGLGI